MVKSVTLSKSASTSVSLVRTLPTTLESSAPVAVSARPSGASLMALIDNVSLAELVSAPSVMRYVMVGTVPLAFASGVKVQVPSALMMIEPLPAMTAVVTAAYCVASPRMR